mmetsp:Transcript_20294/g.40929  ORF Transcript_20294/g.40929 Transcript_20294/m.40929 type:complete len:285 (-) Transcript_20294:2-856(-)
MVVVLSLVPKEALDCHIDERHDILVEEALHCGANVVVVRARLGGLVRGPLFDHAASYRCANQSERHRFLPVGNHAISERLREVVTHSGELEQVEGRVAEVGVAHRLLCGHPAPRAYFVLRVSDEPADVGVGAIFQRNHTLVAMIRVFKRQPHVALSGAVPHVAKRNVEESCRRVAWPTVHSQREIAPCFARGKDSFPPSAGNGGIDLEAGFGDYIRDSDRDLRNSVRELCRIVGDHAVQSRTAGLPLEHHMVPECLVQNNSGRVSGGRPEQGNEKARGEHGRTW